MFKNKSGFSLTEIIVSSTLVAVIAVLSSVGISAFINKFNELRSFSLLQEQVMELLETVRYGEVIRDPQNSLNSDIYMGFNGALSLELTHDLTGIDRYGGAKISVPNGNEAEAEAENSRSYVHFYFDRASGKVMCNATADLRRSGTRYPYSICPRNSKQDIVVKDFSIRPVHPRSSQRRISEEDAYFYRIDVEAIIYTNKKADIYKTVNFTTHVSRPIDAASL